MKPERIEVCLLVIKTLGVAVVDAEFRQFKLFFLAVNFKYMFSFLFISAFIKGVPLGMQASVVWTSSVADVSHQGS